MLRLENGLQSAIFLKPTFQTSCSAQHHSYQGAYLSPCLQNAFWGYASPRPLMVPGTW